METRDYIELILAVLGGIGILLAAAGYGLGKYREGQNSRRKDDIENKRSSFELLQDQVDALEVMVGKQKEDIIILQTQNSEKDKKIKEYMELIQNRNPEMNQFIKYLTETANASNRYMKDTGDFFLELHETLKKIEEHLNNHK